MTIRTLSGAAAIAAATLAAPAALAPAAAETTLTFSMWVPWTHPMIKLVYVRWADEVEKATNNRVKIRKLPKAVASPRAHVDAVRTGQADIGFAVHGYSPKRFAAYKFAEFPMLGDSAVRTSVALQRTHEKFFADKGLYKGVKLVGMNMHGPGHIFHRSKQIRTTKDIEGQKMRTGGPVPKAIMEAWGGVAIRQPAPKTYEILSTGVADGVTFPYESVDSFRITKIVPYATEIPGGLYSSSHFLVMNGKKWEALPEEDKKAMAPLMGEGFARLAGEGWDKRNEDGRAQAVKDGTKIITAPKEMVDAIAKLREGFEAEYVELIKPMGVDGKEVIAFFEAEVAKQKK